MTHIALIGQGQQLTMSSREIAELVNSRHADVVRSVERLMESGVIGGYAPAPYTHPQNGQQYMAYHIGKRDSYVVVAQLSPEFTGRLVDRWQELESGAAPKVPQTLAQALRLAADQAEQIERQEVALAIAAPKVDFFDKVVERSTLMTATQVGQKLGMSAIKLNQYLTELGVYSKNVRRGKVFQQWFIDKKLGELKQGEQGYSQALFTTAGEAWVVERFTSEGIE
jgi:phage regulator Rha-like protein